MKRAFSMTKVLVATLVMALVFSTMAFAGPFAGASIGPNQFDLNIGAEFDVISIEIAFTDLVVQTGSTTLPSMDITVFATQTFGNVDVTAGLTIDYKEFSVWGTFPEIKRLLFDIDAIADLAQLLDTTWTVNLTGNAGFIVANKLSNSTFVWGVGIYVEMPWPTTVQADSSSL